MALTRSQSFTNLTVYKHQPQNPTSMIIMLPSDISQAHIPYSQKPIIVSVRLEKPWEVVGSQLAFQSRFWTKRFKLSCHWLGAVKEMVLCSRGFLHGSQQRHDRHQKPSRKTSGTLGNLFPAFVQSMELPPPALCLQQRCWTPYRVYYSHSALSTSVFFVERYLFLLGYMLLLY